MNVETAPYYTITIKCSSVDSMCNVFNKVCREYYTNLSYKELNADPSDNTITICSWYDAELFREVLVDENNQPMFQNITQTFYMRVM